MRGCRFGLAFAVRSLCQRDGAWLDGWVRAAFLVCLFAVSLFVIAPNYALGGIFVQVSLIRHGHGLLAWSR